MGSVRIVAGPPCSGKTTYVEERRQAEDVVVELDRLYIALGAQETHDHPKAMTALALAAREAIYDHLADRGVPDVDVWIVAGLPKASDRRALAERLGASVIVLETPLSVCQARAEAERPDGWSSYAERWWNTYEPDDLDEVFRHESPKSRRGTMRTKTFTADIKAADVAADASVGKFQALVSVFGNVDHAGDRVVKGAFAKSLRRWKDSGDPIPVVFSHRWDDLDAHIGKVLDAEETEDGLLVTAELDIADDPSAAKVHRLLKDRRIREFSFAYDVLDERPSDDGANELLELDIIEVGPTLKGMNPDTVLVSAKRRRKVYAPLAGSVEQRQHEIEMAVRAYAHDELGAWAYVEATFDDRVVFAVEDDDGTRYLEATYTVTDDGVELDEPREVEVEATIRAASRAAKAGRILSAKNVARLSEAAGSIRRGLDLIDEVVDEAETSSPDGEAGGKAKPDAKPEDPDRGKGEERQARSHVTSPADLRTQIAIDMARL